MPRIRALFEGFTSNLTCNNPPSCRNVLNRCPYHEAKRRVSRICDNSLVWQTEVEFISDLRWLIVGPFGLYEHTSPLKFSLLDFRISNVEDKENIPPLNHKNSINERFQDNKFYVKFDVMCPQSCNSNHGRSVEISLKLHR